MVFEAKGKKVYCLLWFVFAVLDPLDLATLLATVHPRCRRLTLHLVGSICNTAAAESPMQEKGAQAILVGKL